MYLHPTTSESSRNINEKMCLKKHLGFRKLLDIQTRLELIAKNLVLASVLRALKSL